jgi:hypothetical protein
LKQTEVYLFVPYFDLEDSVDVEPMPSAVDKQMAWVLAGILVLVE